MAENEYTENDDFNCKSVHESEIWVLGESFLAPLEVTLGLSVHLASNDLLAFIF